MKSNKKPSFKEVDALATKYAKKQIALYEDYEALAEKLHNELEAKIAKWPESAKNMVLELQSSKFDKMMDQKDNSEVEDSSSENEHSFGEAETLATEYAEKQLALYNNYEELVEKLDEELEALAAEWPESTQSRLITRQASKFTEMLDKKMDEDEDEDEDEDKPTTKKKKKKDDDDEGCGFIFIKLALIVIVVCAAYFTKPSNAKIWDEISKKELILKAPPRIHDFFVFKVAKYDATDLIGEHSGVAFALFGFVWIP